MKTPFSIKGIKRFLSFGRSLRNDKLMIVVSLVLATIVWFNIISGPANITDRSIEVDVAVDLAGSTAYKDGLRIVGNSEFAVKVNVSGPWATLVKLDETDLRVRADLNAVTRNGVNDVPLIVSANSTVSDYDILSVIPSTVQITCEYWKQGDIFEVEVDTTGIMVEDPETIIIGTPVLDTTDFSTGFVTIDGPEDVVESIDRIVAKIETNQPLKKQQLFEVPLTAYDKIGRELDISACEIREVPNGMVHVTVPLWERRTLNVTYTLDNLPSNVVDADAFAQTYIRVEPSQLVACGVEKTLDSAQKKLDLGAIDFEELLKADLMKKEYTVVVPDEDGVEVERVITVSVIGDTLQSATLTVTPSENTVRFVDGTGQDITARMKNNYHAYIPDSQRSLNLSLLGEAESIATITGSDFVWTVTIDSTVDTAVTSYRATIAVKGYDDVWIIGEDQLGEYMLSVAFSQTTRLTQFTLI